MTFKPRLLPVADGNFTFFVLFFVHIFPVPLTMPESMDAHPVFSPPVTLPPVYTHTQSPRCWISWAVGLSWSIDVVVGSVLCVLKFKV